MILESKKTEVCHCFLSGDWGEDQYMAVHDEVWPTLASKWGSSPYIPCPDERHAQLSKGLHF